jgi:hypothetical protein
MGSPSGSRGAWSPATAVLDIEGRTDGRKGTPASGFGASLPLGQDEGAGGKLPK